MSAAPFFIVGCGRSGTSLLRSILAAHPDVAIPTESLFIIDYLRVQDRIELGKLIDLIVREPELQEWGFQYAQEDLESCGSVPAVIRRLHELYAHSRGKVRWGQKTPRFVRSLDLLAVNFPDSRFIHLVRDPRAVVSSLIDSDVHRSDPLHGVTRWINDVGAGVAFESDQPARILRTSYEHLVAEPRRSLERICEFLNLDFEPGMIEHRGGRETYGEFYNNIHANLDRELSAEHRETWRRKLNPGEIGLIEFKAGNLMRRLGYEPQQEPASPPATLAARFRLRRLWNLIPQLWRYLRYRRAYLFFLLYRKAKLGLLTEFLWTVHY
jgi:hypothetical protein